MQQLILEDSQSKIEEILGIIEKNATTLNVMRKIQGARHLYSIARYLAQQKSNASTSQILRYVIENIIFSLV